MGAFVGEEVGDLFGDSVGAVVGWVVGVAVAVLVGEAVGGGRVGVPSGTVGRAVTGRSEGAEVFRFNTIVGRLVALVVLPPIDGLSVGKTTSPLD